MAGKRSGGKTKSGGGAKAGKGIKTEGSRLKLRRETIRDLDAKQAGKDLTGGIIAVLIGLNK